MAKSKKSMLSLHVGGAMKQKEDTEDNIKRKLIIKNELKDYIPPLTEDEYLQLQKNILKEGCRDPLVIWKHENEYVLVDGHNRFKICTENNIQYNLVQKDFASLDHVKEWMIANQLGKRNLPEEAKAYFRGLQYEMEKKNRENNLKQNTITPKGQNELSESSPDQPKGQNELSESSPNQPKGQNELSANTAQKLAKEHKKSESTIKRDHRYALGINKIAASDSLLKWKILNKELDIPKNVVIDLAEKSEKEVDTFRDLVLKNQVSQAIRTIEQEVKEKPSKNLKEKPENELDLLQTQIINNLKKASQKKDRQAFEDIKGLLDNLEKLLFGKPG
ncbi:MAG: ParB N-terminal domain-containing protein [Bacteroidia bacterium]|nr:ParB N-terminal domain-containing protein [Bacteroidia bacterium]